MELIDKIVTHLDSLTLYFFQLSCRYIFIICQYHFWSRYNYLYKTTHWAGTRIAAFGDYTYYIPKHMIPASIKPDDPSLSLENADQEDLNLFKEDEDIILDGEFDDTGQKVKGKMYSLHLYDYFKSNLRRNGFPIFDHSIDKPKNPASIKKCRKECDALPKKYRKIALEWGIDNGGRGPGAIWSVRPYIDADETLLRNLTTHEYVLHSEISVSKSKKYIQGAWNKGPIGFVEVLKCMFCFSNDPSVSMSFDGPEDLHRGPWAGHRFDIVTLAEHNEQIEEEGKPKDYWKDVSFEVRKKIKRIWDGEEEMNSDDYKVTYELLVPLD